MLASAGNTAFFVIFGIFVVAMLALVVIVIMWAVRHDMAGRKAWRARQESRMQPPHRSARSVVVSDPPRHSGTLRRTLRPVLSDAMVTGSTSRCAGALVHRPRPARWAQRRHGSNGRHRAPERTAFVLAGGGSRGAVQVGMLQELIRRGIRADRVYGASVGAINGAAYAGQPTMGNAERMADIWRA